MAFQYLPTIYHSSIGTYHLPGPVEPVECSRAHDAKQFKIPLADGEKSHGISANGWVLNVRGLITQTYDATNNVTVLATEQAMFDELQLLQQKVNRRGEQKYEFFLIHDAAGATYRKYKCCRTLSFNWVMDDYGYIYTLAIASDHSDIYTTAPGA